MRNFKRFNKKKKILKCCAKRIRLEFSVFIFCLKLYMVENNKENSCKFYNFMNVFLFCLEGVYIG